MFKQSRFFFSLSIITVLSVSIFFLPNDVSAKTKRCPVELPKPLLTLYLQSETVVIADIANEKFTRVTDENSTEESSYFNIERNLSVVKTFKGQKMNEISFTKSEYRPNKQDDFVNEIDEVYLEIEYGSSVKLEKGKRYLFFFNKGDEEGFYQTDYRSGVREITSENEAILGKRLDELGKILAMKKNQFPKLAEWLVRMTEEPQTRWDGATTLSRSFSGLGSEIEEGEPEDQMSLLLNENFDEYSPALAKQITDSQKQRLSDVFIASLNEHFFGGSKSSDYDSTMGELVGNWDSVRLAVYGFGILQSVDSSNTEKTAEVMRFISDMAKDGQLYEIYYEFNEKIREAEESEVEQETAKITQDMEVREGEIPIETKSEPSEKLINEDKQVVDKTEKPTPQQIREEIMKRFFMRYQNLLARNFEPEPEPETQPVKEYAEIIR